MLPWTAALRESKNMANADDSAPIDGESGNIPEHRTAPVQGRAWTFAGRSIAILLFLTAFLKTHALATYPVIPRDFLESRWAQLIAVEFEIFLAVWLLSGSGAKYTRWTCMVAFMLFSVISAARVVLGQDNCGCFGRVPLHPAVTLVLDVVVVLLLLSVSPAPEPRSFAWPSFVWFLFYSVAAVSAGVVAIGHMPRTIDDTGIIPTGGGIVLIEPGKWIGKTFPLLGHVVGNAEQLATGEWTIVFFHHNCNNCREVVLSYHQDDGFRENKSIAFIEVPPYGDIGVSLTRGPILQLNDHFDWFISTPSVIELKDGIVLASTPTIAE